MKSPLHFRTRDPGRALQRPPARTPLPALLPTPFPVWDDDVQRGRLSAGLAAMLAPQLGLDLRRLRLHVDESAARRTAAAAACGLAEGNRVFLHPRRYDPRTAGGRSLLAHELVHVAQSGRDGPVAETPAAEAEAVRMARAFAEGRVLDQPRARLRPDVAAADRGEAEPMSAAELMAWEMATEEADLQAAAASNHARILADIEDATGGVVVSDDDVTRALSAMSDLELPTARALIRALAAPLRVRLAENINPVHGARFRRQIVAVLSALTPTEVHEVGTDPLEALPLQDLADDERPFVLATLRRLPAEAIADLRDGDQSAAVHALMTTPAPGPGKHWPLLSAALAEEQASAERRLTIDRDAGFQTLLADLTELLAEPDAKAAEAALLRIAVFQPGRPDGRKPGRRTAEERPATPTSDSAADTAIAAPRTAPIREEFLAELVGRLEPSGAIERLIDQLPVEVRCAKETRWAFLAVMRQRRPDKSLAQAVDLLSYGLFDWAVRDPEAKLAYDLLTALPPAWQDRFRRLEDGLYLRRLYDNLPREFVLSEFFAGIEAARDAKGNLVDRAGALAGILADRRQAFDRLLKLFDQGVDGDNAPGLLDKLLAIGEDERDLAQRAEVRAAFVRRLDILGHIAALFAELPERVLYDEGRWQDLATVFLARDPLFVAHHARELLRRGFTDWVITSEDAFLAFQLVRALPEDERARFEQAEGGRFWSRMWDEMTQAMRASPKVNLYLGDERRSGQDKVRNQLADPAAWTADNVDRLGVLIRLAIAMGDHRWVFARSQAVAAHRVPRLRPLVARFQLFDPDAGRTTFRQAEGAQEFEGASWYQDGFFQGLGEVAGLAGLVFGGGWELFLSRKHIALVADLEEIQDRLGGELGKVARVGKTPGERKPLELESLDALRKRPNMVFAWADADTRTITVELSELCLQQVYWLSSGLRLDTGAVRLAGLRAEVGFTDDTFEHLDHLLVQTGALEIADLLITTSGHAVGAGRLQLTPVQAAAGAPPEGGRAADAPDLDTYAPIPVLWPLIGLVVNLFRYWGLLTQKAKDPFSHGGGLMTTELPALAGLEASFGALTVDQVVSSAGVNLAGIAVEDVLLTFGANRAAALRGQLRSIDHRLARWRRTGEAGKRATEIAELAARRTELQQELKVLLPKEQDLVALVRKFHADPDAWTAADQQALDALQDAVGLVGATGGATLDVGRIQLTGADGKARFDDLTVRNLHGEGESGALALKFVSEPELIRRFLDQGPPDQDLLALTADAGVTVTADDVAVTNLVLAGEIPTVAQLEQEIAALPRDARFDAHRTKLEGLVTDVARYEELRRRAPDPADRDRWADPAAWRSPEDQAELNRLARDLAKAFGLSVGSLTVQRPELELSVGDKRLRVKTGEITAVDLRGRDWSVDKLTLPGLQGTLRLDDDGVHIDGLELGSLTLDAIDYASPTQRIRAPGTTTLTGIHADLTLPFEDVGAAREITFRTYHVRKLIVDRIEAPGLAYAGFDEKGGFAYSLEITAGAIGDFWMEDFWLRLAADKDQATTWHGELGIDAFDNLQVKAAYGEMLQVTGTLDSTAVPDGAPSPGTGAFGIGWAEDGTQRIHLNALGLKDGVVTTPSGSVRVVRTSFSGEIVKHGDHTSINQLTLPELVLADIDWRFGTSATLKSKGHTVLHGVELNGEYQAGEEGKAVARVKSLRIAEVTADQLIYEDHPLKVELKPVDELEQSGLRLVDIRVDGLELRQDRGWMPTAGTVRIPNAGNGDPTQPAPSRIRADFLVTYATDLSVTGRLWADDISVGFQRDGTIVARSTHLDVNADVAAGGASANLQVTGLDTGEIRYGNGVLSIGAEGRPGFHMEEMLLTHVDFESPDFSVKSTGGLPVALYDLKARLDVHFRTDQGKGKGGGKDAGVPIEKIVLREFHLGDLVASGLVIDLNVKGYQITLTLPDGQQAGLHDVELKGVQADEYFEIHAPSGGKGWRMVGLATAGSDLIGAAALPQLGIKVAEQTATGLRQLFDGRASVAAKAITAGFLRTGDVTVDLQNWSVTDIVGKLTPTGDPASAIDLKIFTGTGGTRHAVDHAGLFGKRLGYDSRTGELTLEELAAKGIRFRLPDLGVELDLKQISVPGTMVANIAELMGSGQDRTLVIPELVIDEAWFGIDHLAKLIDKLSDKTSAPKPFDYEAFLQKLSPYQADMKALNGKIVLQATLPYLGDFDVDVPIVNGQVNVADLQHAILKFSGIVQFDVNERLRALTLDALLPSGNINVDEPHRVPIVMWDLTANEAHVASTTNLVSLYRLLHVESPYFPDYKQWGKPAPGAEKKGADEEQEEPGAFEKETEIHKLELHLDLSNRGTITVPLGAAGKLVLASKALQDLVIKGNLQPIDDLDYKGRPNRTLHSVRKEDTERPGQMSLSLGGLHLESLDLTLPGDAGRRGIGLHTGALTITGVKDTTLDFAGWTPTRLEGTVTKATAKDIRIVLDPSGSATPTGKTSPAPAPGATKTPTPIAQPKPQGMAPPPNAPVPKAPPGPKTPGMAP
ncbi:MAG: DUF4157 domain-containing protein [Planctomycetes bacterium]|nr:DUF4157 domain-containing protein [Planctomycetota bacterium]